jgi:hypothetical protein
MLPNSPCSNRGRGRDKDDANGDVARDLAEQFLTLAEGLSGAVILPIQS